MIYVEEWVLALLWLAIAVVGGLIAVASFRAWRRERSRSMLALGGGFAVLSIGAAAAWFLAWILEVGYSMTMAVTCGATLAGFSIILYALYTRLG